MNKENWDQLSKIATPDKWIEMYLHYQELLSLNDVASFWQDQYFVANKERNDLKKEIIKLKKNGK